MQLGFIGFGEASFELASGLKQEIKGMIAYDPLWNISPYKERLLTKAKSAQVTIAESQREVIQSVQVLIVAVPANKALEVSEELKDYLHEEIIYVDVTATSPDSKKQIAANVNKQGCAFIDAAMMGALPVYKHKVPILASGDGTDQFITMMSEYGMNITKVNNIPGDATVVKLIRSIYMKGVVGLYIELLEAAHKYDVEEFVIGSLNGTINGRTFEETMNRLVTGTSIHAFRRSIELDGTIDLLESVGIDSSMTKAAKEKIASLVELNLKEKFKGEKPENWLQVIEAI